MRNKLILSAILLLGLLIRSYNIGFPSIGYHNMKENEYLSMAQEMKRTGDYATRRIYFYHAFEDNPLMKLYPQPPMVSYQTLLAWNLFGENLWDARLFNVIWGLLSILVIYLMAELLFKDTLAAFASALLLALMPLAVFFSRNLQPESGAFFFMLLGSFFYLKFCSEFKKRYILFCGLSFSFAWLYKFSFLIGLFPILFCLPLRSIIKDRKELLKCLLLALASFIPLLLSIAVLKALGQWQFEQLSRVRLLEIFTPAYWHKYGKMIWWYVRGENFTLTFTALTCLGAILAFIKRRGLLERYIIGLSLSILPYAMIFSDYINQHNYYQMPYLSLVCLSCVYFIFFASSLLEKLIGKKIFIILFALTVAAAGYPAYQAVVRMYGTVFLGEDIAGESLKEFTKPGERVFISTHVQGYGIARYAQRYMEWPKDIDEFKSLEDKFGIRYICIYPADRVGIMDPKIMDYVRQNYHLKEAGISEQAGNNVTYFILEKGAPKENKEFLQSFSGKMQPRTIYKLMGRYMFFYTIRP